MAFTLIEFLYYDIKYIMGFSISPADAEEAKENIVFVFQESIYREFEEFQKNSCVAGVRISELENPIKIIRAGIVDGEALLKTLWEIQG